MRVLYVIPSMSHEWGGSATSVSGLATALVQQGITCEIVTTVGPRVGSDARSIPGVPIHCFDANFLSHVWTAFSYPATRFLFREAGRYDIIHIQEMWHYLGYCAFHAARSHGIPCMVSIRGELDSWRLRHHRFRKWIYQHCIQIPMLHAVDAVHALTRTEADILSDFGLEKSVFLAPNGIEPRSADRLSGKALFLARYPHLEDRRIILFISRLTIMKGLDVLANSFIKVASRIPDAMLVIAGPDEDGSGARLRSLMEKAGLSDRVVFPGLLIGDLKWAAFAAADCMVLPSYSEGFSNVVIEAMSTGCPVIVSDKCNFPEVAEHEAGIVVEVDHDAVAKAIDTLLMDDVLRDRMGCNARQLVNEHYRWSSIAASFADHYRYLAGDAG